MGTIGCSSTAEWQLGVAALGNPAFTTMIPEGFGAGVGRVGPYYEQGNWYRGGAVQMLFIAWLYGEQNQRPIEPTIYLSSDVKDTDITVKIIDVLPDGVAYNLDETIQRVRYREGYDKAPVMMQPGKVYKVTLQPTTTSNYFDVGHRVRIEVSSSNFPRFDRNLNTGGKNYDETAGVVAHNTVHHSSQYPSQVVFTVMKKKQQITANQ